MEISPRSAGAPRRIAVGWPTEAIFPYIRGRDKICHIIRGGWPYITYHPSSDPYKIYLSVQRQKCEIQHIWLGKNVSSQVNAKSEFFN